MLARLVSVFAVIALFATGCGDNDDTVEGADPTAIPTSEAVPTATPTTEPAPTPTEVPLGAGPYPVADLEIAYEHPDLNLQYAIDCQGDTATSSGDSGLAGIDPESACLALTDPT